MLQSHKNLLGGAVVGNGPGDAVGQDNGELAAGEHAGEGALALTYGQRTCTVVPGEDDGGVGALLVEAASLCAVYDFPYFFSHSRENCLLPLRKYTRVHIGNM